MTASNGNIFRVTGLLCGEFTGDRWIPHTKASDAELWRFLWSTPNKRLSKQMQGWWFETHSLPSWRHSNSNVKGLIHRVRYFAGDVTGLSNWPSAPPKYTVHAFSQTFEDVVYIGICPVLLLSFEEVCFKWQIVIDRLHPQQQPVNQEATYETRGFSEAVCFNDTALSAMLLLAKI